MFSRKKDLVALRPKYPYNEDVVDSGFGLWLEEQLLLGQINEILLITSIDLWHLLSDI
jgi:hypothetical protein